MTIQQDDNSKKGKFFIVMNNIQVAEMTYTHAGPEKIIIDHTDVNPEFKGKGLGYKLLDAAVAFLRENNLKALPLCPFAKATFDKKPEYADVLF